MKARDEWKETMSQADMERLLAGIDEADYRVDDEIAGRIRRKTLEQIRPGQSGWFVKPARRLAAAVFVIAALSLLSPQVQARVRQLVALIPGIGMVETGGTPMLLARDVAILDGKDRIIGKPVLMTGPDGIRLTLQVREDGAVPKTERPFEFDFTAAINGTAIEGKPQGWASGGEDQTVYQIYFAGKPQADDVIHFRSPSLGIAAEGKLTPLASQDPLTMPHAQSNDILIMADPVRNGQGWDLYMHAISDKVRPTSFIDSYDFASPLVFAADDGTKIPVDVPDSYGTGFMPPLTVEVSEVSGDLVIPSLSWGIEDAAEFTFTVPEDDEVLRPGNGFTLAGFPIRVEQIRRSTKGQLELELSWINGAVSLDWFSVDESNSMSLEDGRMVLKLDDRWSVTGRRTVRFRGPELTAHQELRIPLDLSSEP